MKTWLGRKKFEDRYAKPDIKKHSESHVDSQGNIFTRITTLEGNCMTIIRLKNGVEFYRDTTYYDFDNRSSIPDESGSNNSALMGALLGFTIGRM